MRTVAELLAHLRRLGVRIWTEGDNLHLSAASGRLTPELYAELAERKSEILTFLREASLTLRATAPPIRPVSRSGDLPLSFAQQRLWFLNQLEGPSATYNIPVAFHLSGSLDVAALKQSLTEIVRRHQVLCTVFSVVDGSPVQGIAPPQAVSLRVLNLQDLPATARSAEVQRLVAEEARRPFNLEQGPLLRVSLLRLGASEYVLLVTMHHIVSDGWSMGVFTRELSTLYEAFLAGRPSPLSELSIQYADFAHWQRQWLQEDIADQCNPLKTQLAYWKQQLADAPPVLELPTDRPRPPVRTYRGRTERFELSANLRQGLEGLSQQSGATLFMTFLTAFAALLARYSCQEDMVVGSPIANRNRREIEPLIGFFVNTLALRIDLSGSPTFRELLNRVREVALGAYEHQDMPFERLVEALQPERDLSHTALFQVMFAMQNAPMASLELTGLTVSPVEVDTGTAKFDLTLFLEEKEDGMVGAWEYNTDLFEAATIARMAVHFHTLLEGIVANPDRRLSELPLLTEAELHRLLIKWNDTKADYPQDRCIHQLFEAQVERTPEAIAVTCEEKTLTYGELNRRANQLAHYLRKLGVGPEVIVGIYLERSLEMVVGLLGVFKAGGAYMPLDFRLPPARIAFMMEDTQSLVLLTQQRLGEELPEQQARRVHMDTDWDAIAQESAENPVSETTVENLVYVLFTSGSTGRSKGVVIEHRQLLNYLNGILEELDLATGASFALVSTFAADLGNTVIFSSLCTGGCLHVIPWERASDPEALADYFHRHPIDCLKIVPSHLRALLSASHPEHVLPHQRLVLGGEATHWDLIKELLSLAPDCLILNHYGPTETTVGVIVYRPTRDQLQEEINDTRSTTLPLGRPIANAQIYLLDSCMQPVPIGVPGELYIGGDSLARGYLNRPDLTAERFIPNPFSDQPGGRLYRTGDLARYLPDGHIEFLGRLDYQVKIRGFRVELGEIETILEEHPDVQDAVVVTHETEDWPGDKRLVAYVVAGRGRAPTVKELQDFLKRELPDYMIPSTFIMLDAIPLTPNGKVDRRALLTRGASRLELGEIHAVPRNAVEEILTDICANVLGVEDMGIYDNFFELGGHSLLAAQFISRVRQTFQVELPLRSLFESQTMANLAKTLVKYEPVPGQVVAIARLRKKISKMSTREVQALLREKAKV